MPVRAGFITYQEITLQPSEVRPMAVSGSVFRCLECDARFFMKVDDGEEFKFELGLGFRLPSGDEFKKLSFRNASATETNTIAFFHANAVVEDARLNTLIERQIDIGIRATPTRLVCTEDSLGAGTVIDIDEEITIPGVNAGQRRKQIVVTNLDFDNCCQILNEDGELFAVVFPRTAWIKETNATIIVTNSGLGDDAPAAITVAIGESYYDV